MIGTDHIDFKVFKKINLENEVDHGIAESFFDKINSLKIITSYLLRLIEKYGAIQLI